MERYQHPSYDETAFEEPTMAEDRAFKLGAVAVVFSLVFPLVIGILLRAPIAAFWFVFIPGIKVILYAGRHASVYNKRVFRMLSRITTLLWAGFLLIYILITPYSAYRLWLENFTHGYPEGQISGLMTQVIAFFSTVLSGTFFSAGYLWPFLGMALVIATLSAFIFKSAVSMLLVVLAVTVSIGYAVLRRTARQHQPRVARFVAVLFAVSVLITAALSANKMPLGNKLVDQRIYPFLRLSAVEYFPNIRLPDAVPGYGFGFDETKRLGGRPLLSENPLFEIYYERPGRMYLRTRSYDTYQGNNWTQANKSEKSADSEVFLLSHRRRSTEVRIRLLTDYYSHLPHTLNTARVRFIDKIPNLERGNWDTGFHLIHPLKQEDEFYLQIAPSSSSLPRNQRPEDLSSYLQIPQDMPDSVRHLAEKIAQGAADDQAVLHRIIKYLAYNYSYTLDMEDEYVYHEDFVTDFLFGELQGYCVHFATSFTLLARLNEIPTRYATGFVVNHSGRFHQTVVTGEASHAWPEVWLDGMGWTVWEATPSEVDLQIGEEDKWLLDLVDTFDPSSLDQASLASAEEFTEANRIQRTDGGGGDFASLLWIAPGLLLAGGAVALRRPIHRSIVVGRRNRESLLYLSGRLVSDLKKHGIEQPQENGWIRWGDRIGRRFPPVSRSAARVTKIINHSMFGRRKTAGRDVEYLDLFYRKVRRLSGR